MATVEQLRIEIQQELLKAETNFNGHLANLKERLDTQDNFDKSTQDTVGDLSTRMAGFDTASTNFATQVSVNDAALKQIQAEQTKGLEEMRSGLEEYSVDLVSLLFYKIWSTATRRRSRILRTR